MIVNNAKDILELRYRDLTKGADSVDADAFRYSVHVGQSKTDHKRYFNARAESDRIGAGPMSAIGPSRRFSPRCSDTSGAGGKDDMPWTSLNRRD